MTTDDVTESDYYSFMHFDADNATKVLSYYTPMFTVGPVLELACGPGVFLTLLRDAGIEATGVDLDDGMVATARGCGHEVVSADALEHVRSLPDESLNGLFAAHFLEHLAAPDVQALYDQAARVLRPGGVFVAVVPNAACLSVMGHDFWRDPTHVRFYDPVVLQFFATRAGLAISASGGNPHNHPGPPPHLLALPATGLMPLRDNFAALAEHSVSAAKGLSQQIGTRLARATPNAAAVRTGFADQAALWLEAAHLLTAVDEEIQTVNHHLATLTSAYGQLLAQLYPPNEVFVAAHKPRTSSVAE